MVVGDVVATGHRFWRKKYDALMKKDLAHPIEKVGAQLRARMPWLNQG